MVGVTLPMLPVQHLAQPMLLVQHLAQGPSGLVAHQLDQKLLIFLVTHR